MSDAPAGVTTPPATTETVTPGAWTAGFNDDIKGYATAKGFKDAASVVDAYRNLEKFQGVPIERLMKLPERFADDKGVMTAEARQVYERLGAPKDAKGYEADKLLPKEGGDPKFMEWFASTATELGLTKNQFEKIVRGVQDRNSADFKAQQEQGAQLLKDQQDALKKEWGAAHDNNIASVREGARRLGHDQAKIDSLERVMGYAETMKFYKQIGTAVGESAFVGGEKRNSNPALEPATAKAKIAELMSDRGFSSKINEGDRDAIGMLTRLHQEAYPGETSL